MNITSETEFHIFTFSTSENESIIILTFVLLIYLVILSGNLLVTSLISLDHRLHTPMYFFLYILSTLDIMYVSTTLPKLMYICHTGDHVMSYTSCMAQLYLYLFFGDTECFLLTSMAGDRYVAVCFPLRYSLIMSKQVCVLLAFSALFMALVNASIITCFAYSLTFFGLVDIKNFFCELKALMNVSYYNTLSLKTFLIVDSIILGVIPSCMILASYIGIIYSILKIKSPGGR
ncbi:hypothetical protein GDO81_029200 [Engystomops pustulosus]|uniref:G-protein coupled receptors family 1 profile domain-containing protein n=1 Tax=Engystomops pustulosus TaxID=76066 RepID=A0AAV6Z237_ENGPU|nr:hypothetical protein GDO81_029200 [Engystomops pustulosus]